MTEAAEQPGLTAQGAIADDRPCLTCGYSLTGLDPRGECPECGAPVERSAGEPLLAYGDAAYVGWLWRGATASFAGLFVFAASAVFLIFWTIGGQRTGGWPAAMSFVAVNGMSLAAPALYLAGWAFLTTPEPAARAGDPAEGPRRVCRFAVYAGGAATFLTWAWLLTARLTATPPIASGPVTAAGGQMLRWLAVIATAVSHAVVFFTGLTMLRRMSSRFSPAETVIFLRRKSRALQTSGALVIAGAALALSYGLLLQRAYAGAWEPWQPLMVVFAVLAYGAAFLGSPLALVFYVVYMAYLWRVKSALARIRAQQRSKPAPTGGAGLKGDPDRERQR